MYIKGFKINIDRNKRLWGAILFALLIAVILIIISFIYIFRVSNKNIKYTKSDLFNATSFYAEYTVNVYSNKNKNMYKIKEWYIKNNDEYKFRIETNNDNNNFIYLGTNNSISIKSDEQISEINLQNYVSNQTNILSISTFINILNSLDDKINKKENDSDCCKIDEIEHDDKVSYIIQFTKENNVELNVEEKICKICKKIINSGMKISKIELILNKDKLIPNEYIVYDDKGNAYVDITYDNFVINTDFDKKLFAF